MSCSRSSIWAYTFSYILFSRARRFSVSVFMNRERMKYVTMATQAEVSTSLTAVRTMFQTVRFTLRKEKLLLSNS